MTLDAGQDERGVGTLSCVGQVEAGSLIGGGKGGAGNVLLLIGASTGRDGIGGVSVLASRTLDEDAHLSRPSVQIGDPFAEKLLIEACLELAGRGLLDGLQDLGGAGLTCAVSETAARRGAGADLDLDQVVLREPGMEPFEILTSESQERMLAVIRPDDLEAAREVCAKWGLSARAVGRLRGGGQLFVRRGGRVVAKVPAKAGDRDGWTASGKTTLPSCPCRYRWRMLSMPSWGRQAWRASDGRSSSTTRWCRDRPWSARARMPRSSAWRERSRRWRFRPTATGGTGFWIPTSAGPTRWRRARGTWRRSAPALSPSPTA